ncbi:GNAT family N-acetyltransferase [Paenibacillus prosopidis]|uniref:Acetyltransferase (GNAT) family protein n=1 Tax=Paenibacillus prosopidis TaxID=630520 RepID=A0A368W349_9BACL|nr:hypothetical protein DFP97_1045 [Paenibacillus prosopidis]
MLTFAFEKLNFNRVQFSVDTDNLRSQKAVLKLGAKQEGIFRSNYINAKGEPRDDVYFSIIKSEWPGIKLLCLVSLLHESVLYISHYYAHGYDSAMTIPFK